MDLLHKLSENNDVASAGCLEDNKKACLHDISSMLFLVQYDLLRVQVNGYLPLLPLIFAPSPATVDVHPPDSDILKYCLQFAVVKIISITNVWSNAVVSALSGRKDTEGAYISAPECSCKIQPHGDLVGKLNMSGACNFHPRNKFCHNKMETKTRRWAATTMRNTRHPGDTAWIQWSHRPRWEACNETEPSEYKGRTCQYLQKLATS